MVRSSAVTLAVAYVLIGLVALGLFATPLWYAWRVTIEDGRTEILQGDAQRFGEVFRQMGADGLVAFLDERVRRQIAAERLQRRIGQQQQPLGRDLHAHALEVPAEA